MSDVEGMAGEEGGTERRTDWVERQFFLTLAVVILLELCCAVWLFA
jgi:hypothetical protein